MPRGRVAPDTTSRTQRKSLLWATSLWSTGRALFSPGRSDPNYYSSVCSIGSMVTVDPEFGDQVTYIDGDGQPHLAIILEPIPDAEYVTLAAAETANPQEELVGVHWQIETSVYPHDDTGHEYACGSHAYKPGWQ